MPTNVTQKDKTLNEIIAWAKKIQDAEFNVAIRCNAMGLGDASDWHAARDLAFGDVIDHCKCLLGYSGTMPLEVENQSEDARQEKHA